MNVAGADAKFDDDNEAAPALRASNADILDCKVAEGIQSSVVEE